MAPWKDPGEDYAMTVLSALESGAPVSAYGLGDARPDVGKRIKKERADRFRIRAKERYDAFVVRVAKMRSIAAEKILQATALCEAVGFEHHDVQIYSSVYESDYDKWGFPNTASVTYFAEFSDGRVVRSAPSKDAEVAGSKFLTAVKKICDTKGRV